MNRTSLKCVLNCGVAVVALMWQAGALAETSHLPSATGAGDATRASLVKPLPAQAPAASAPVEEVLVTGSLIHGAAVVGVPVTVLGTQDFQQTGALNITDAMKNVPSVQLLQGLTTAPTHNDLGLVNYVNIHGVGPLENLVLVDGMRTPLQGRNRFADPSIVNPIAVDHVDVLADGASATYGSDAVSGVVNVTLKRNFDGAVTQGSFVVGDGFNQWKAAQLFGRTWNSGGIVVSFESQWLGALHAADRPSIYNSDASTIGSVNRTLAAYSIPATLSAGSASYVNGVGGACSNCYAVPTGLGPTGIVTFSGLAAGTNNEEKNYWAYGDAVPETKINAATLTFDQDVTEGVHFFANAYYSNRRSRVSFPGNTPTSRNNAMVNIALPATGYPFLTPGYPTNLRVNLDLSPILNQYNVSTEIADRYDGGFNVDLPMNWKGKIEYALSEDKLQVHQENQINPNNLATLLGKTITATQPGTNQPVTITKPANLDLFNVFCDTSQFTCMDQAQIDYIRGYAHDHENHQLNEVNATFDGPLFSLPGGDVRMAVGGDYYTDNFSYELTDATKSVSAQMPLQPSEANGEADYLKRKVWAAFAQLNVPVVGADNAMPMVQKLSLELSARYDHYSDFGHTTNPKIGVNWSPFEGLELRGSWGSSFRAPTLSDESDAGRSLSGINGFGGTALANTPNCPAGATMPVPGSAGAAILAATGQTCASLPYSPGFNLKSVQPPGTTLGPETARNWTLGGEFAPSWIPGLDVDLTYYELKISDVLGAVGGSTVLTDPRLAFVVSTVGQPDFTAEATRWLSDATSQVAYSPANVAALQFLVYNGSANVGTLKQSGLDFNASYSLPTDDMGTWKIGTVGSYTFHQYYSPAPGAAFVDIAGTNTTGPEALGPLKWRMRNYLGWSDNGFNVTAFVNYQSGYTNTSAFAFPAHVPSFTTADLSISYDLGDRPQNKYLQNIQLQLVVNDLLDPHPPAVDDSSFGGTTTDLYHFSPIGRTYTVTITKDW